MKMHYVIVLCVVGIAFAADEVGTEPAPPAEPCTSPTGDEGTCKSLLECDILHTMIKKRNRTPQDEHYLRNSKCGFENDIPKVCCPTTDKLSCITPDDNEGKCMSLHLCPPLVELLKDSNVTNKVEYVKNSICAGPMEYSVCCGDTPELSDLEPVVEQCDRTVTALPPDPDGDCCGLDSTVGNKIIGGNVTSINEYPWLVLIEYVHRLDKNKLLCGGSLISGKYVVTAAHCVVGSILKKGIPTYVRLGEYNVTNKGPDCVKQQIGDPDCTDDMILAPIQKITTHPKYDPFDSNKAHDIALVRIKIYAPFTDFIRPICLPKIDYLISPPGNFSFYVAGWGWYLQNITKKIYRNSDVKMHVNVPYVVRDQCQIAIRTIQGAEEITFRSGQICAGGVLGEDSCSGDSGGPLMYENKELRKFELIGVVGSGAEHCGKEGIPGLYTYIYEYIPWIKQTMRP